MRGKPKSDKDPHTVTTLLNDRYLRAALGQPVDVTPVWMMRQAGRYLPEYRQVREKAGSFMDLCRNAELACEVTLQPLRRYDLDAAILFSDILTVPDAMGLGLYFSQGEGPKFERPVRSRADVNRLFVPDVSDSLDYVMQAVRVIRRELQGKVPLIGFSGSPWTLATYMVEGGSTRDFRRIKAMMYEDPAILHQLLDIVTRAVIDYLNAQVEAGAQALMVFDTWGGVLSPRCYREFSLQYMERIARGVMRENEGRTVPLTLFTKGAGPLLADMANVGADCLGVDWTTDLAQAREWTRGQVALQGNLDPSVLYADAETIRGEVKRVLASYGDGPGHVFNLGHGIHQFVDPDKPRILVDAVHDLSARRS
jgi:uroporphyrinogen decarboxylase